MVIHTVKLNTMIFEVKCEVVYGTMASVIVAGVTEVFDSPFLQYPALTVVKLIVMC